MEVTFGGDRIGSGAGMKVAMHNYEMSTHNLSQRFTSTLGVGTLIPCLCIPAMRGDYIDINIEAQARTIPTKGPLFSTYKMQVDIYDYPMRLAQALLHNNPIRLGMNMSQVKLPKLSIMSTYPSGDKWKAGKFADNCLLKYLGMSGLGRHGGMGNIGAGRLINAVPALAYYDIFKNYYANKQEENAYIVATTERIINKFVPTNFNIDGTQTYPMGVDLGFVTIVGSMEELVKYRAVWFNTEANEDTVLSIDGEYSENGTWKKNTYIGYKNANINDWLYYNIETAETNGIIDDIDEQAANITITFNTALDSSIMFIYKTNNGERVNNMGLTEFPLSNIDDMRLDILSYHTLGSSFTIGETKQTGDKDVYLPYSTLTKRNTSGVTANQDALNGICIKTYQSDLFNNWLNTDWIEGENGIAEMSKVAVTDGAIYMDALLFAKKTYNLLNRVAVSDGTYQAWLDAVYTESPKRHIETPMFVGGLSTEIVFEEIVQTSPSEGSALGTLGGRGIMLKRKGGNAYIECDEPSFIIGIVSITPRVYYTQGNEFYMTDLDSVDDMHKPEYDGIGYQNLIGERMCWTDTKIVPGGTTISQRTVIGKVPAWVEYMTAVDKAYGEFTDINSQGFMILNRNYEVDESTGAVKDFTTYIDPSKYNYAFAESTLYSQNFWVQIQFDIKARRKMSAREIPNL